MPKTARTIAGLVYSRSLGAIKWGWAPPFPVAAATAAKLKKRTGLALLPAAQDHKVE